LWVNSFWVFISGRNSDFGEHGNCIGSQLLTGRGAGRINVYVFTTDVPHEGCCSLGLARVVNANKHYRWFQI
jgi:hypothetical protein